MSKTIKIERPKIPLALEPIRFQDVYDEEYFELVNGLISHSEIAHESIERLILSKIIFKNVTFINSTFKNVGLNGCDLNDIDFTETKLNGIDISTCTYEQINVSLESLVGCKVSSEQAIGFSRLLGLEIKE